MNQTKFFKEIIKRQKSNYTMIFESANPNIEEISSNIWNKKYRFNNETTLEFYSRISDNIFYREEIYGLMWNLLRQYFLLIKEYELLDSHFMEYFEKTAIYNWDYIENHPDFQIKLIKDIIKNITFNIIANQYFIPAGRIEYALGTPRANTTMSNCFVMPEVPDSMTGIMDILKDAAITMKAGGGVGYYFGKLRPKHSKTLSTHGYASGPVSFMRIFDTMCQTIESAGGRRGAQIAILPIWHPDILEFATIKKGLTNNELTNFNVSVAITDEFMRALENDEDWDLVFPNFEFYKSDYDEYWNSKDCHTLNDWIEHLNKSPRVFLHKDTGVMKTPEKPLKVYETVKARDLWNAIMTNAYKYSEPGVFFVDNVNNYSPLSYTEYINATNP